MKFQFRLKTALRFTELEESKKKSEIGSIHNRVIDIERRLTLLNRNIRDLLGWSIGREVNVDRLVYQSRKIETDRNELQKLERNLVDIRNLLVQRREELLKIVMKRKALESKEEKDHKAFRTKVSRTEQKRLDDNHQLLKLNKKAEA
ncbi:MAG: flagellar FliJ family protein [Deltaproteobacteria bacterium]|nr:flagellar FliJ family protein [Deltaproteobacteria bacterium]MBI3295200.1 flagellar FliJ family protein [Deltaproteobacteria bacterium]